ncbi:hypothetical protein BF49_0076 [Bradyrhizobium sp.]|nr:hypothetical protein BF49_0076 [Bradyrhizobium sp.]
MERSAIRVLVQRMEASRIALRSIQTTKAMTAEIELPKKAKRSNPAGLVAGLLRR